jgi:hypothetical protein
VIAVKTGAGNKEQIARAMEILERFKVGSMGMIEVVTHETQHAEILAKDAINSMGKMVGGMVSLWKPCNQCAPLFGAVSGTLGAALHCISPIVP